MNTETVTQETALEQKVTPWPQQADAITIETHDQYASAAYTLKAIKSLADEVESHHGPLKKAAHVAWKKIIEAEKKMLEPLQAAERTIKAKMGGFLRLEEEKRRKAEEERRRMEAAERKRIEDERLRQEEEARRKHEEELEAALEQAEAEGADTAELEAIIEQPIVMPDPPAAMEPAPYIPPPAPLPPKVKGVTTSLDYYAEVTDKKALVIACANGIAQLGFVEPNRKALNGMARSLKDTMEVPGVTVRSKPRIGVRR